MKQWLHGRSDLKGESECDLKWHTIPTLLSVRISGSQIPVWSQYSSCRKVCLSQQAATATVLYWCTADWPDNFGCENKKPVPNIKKNNFKVHA